MYNYISGKLEEKGENFLVIETGGIGYELIVSNFCLDKYASIGQNYKVPVLLIVREDEMRLFGFYNNAERNMFKKLIAVSGVGPKVAIAILSGIALDTLTLAILNADTKTLSKIKGIGKKTAERIVLELKDKFGEEYEDLGITAADTAAISSIGEEAVMALISLGLSKSEAVSAVKLINREGLTLEEIVYKALKGK